MLDLSGLCSLTSTPKRALPTHHLPFTTGQNVELPISPSTHVFSLWEEARVAGETQLQGSRPRSSQWDDGTLFSSLVFCFRHGFLVCCMFLILFTFKWITSVNLNLFFCISSSSRFNRPSLSWIIVHQTRVFDTDNVMDRLWQLSKQHSSTLLLLWVQSDYVKTFDSSVCHKVDKVDA